jgi:hypothetical protein
MQSDAQNAEYPISAPMQSLMQAVFKFWSSAHYHRHLIPLPKGSSSSIWSYTRKKYNMPHIYEQSPTKHQPQDGDGRGQFAITPSYTHTHTPISTYMPGASSRITKQCQILITHDRTWRSPAH